MAFFLTRPGSLALYFLARTVLHSRHTLCLPYFRHKPNASVGFSALQHGQCLVAKGSAAVGIGEVWHIVGSMFQQVAKDIDPVFRRLVLLA
jgi:hypothetical protein